MAAGVEEAVVERGLRLPPLAATDCTSASALSRWGGVGRRSPPIAYD